jgi:hypothetical protein
MTRYDVRGALLTSGVRWTIAIRWFGAGAAVFFALLGAGFLYFSVRDHDWSMGSVSAPILCGIFAVLFGVVSRVLPPAPAFLEVDQDGIRFVYPNGRIRGRDWSSPRFKLRMYQTEGTDGPISKGHPTRSLEEISFVIPQEAFEQILGFAASFDITVRKSPSTSAPGWTVLRLTRA